MWVLFGVCLAVSAALSIALAMTEIRAWPIVTVSCACLAIAGHIVYVERATYALMAVCAASMAVAVAALRRAWERDCATRAVFAVMFAILFACAMLAARFEKEKTLAFYAKVEASVRQGSSIYIDGRMADPAQVDISLYRMNQISLREDGIFITVG